MLPLTPDSLGITFSTDSAAPEKRRPTAGVTDFFVDDMADNFNFVVQFALFLGLQDLIYWMMIDVDVSNVYSDDVCFC